MDMFYEKTRKLETCIDYEADGVKPKGRPKKTWIEIMHMHGSAICCVRSQILVLIPLVQQVASVGQKKLKIAQSILPLTSIKLTIPKTRNCKHRRAAAKPAACAPNAVNTREQGKDGGRVR